MRVIMAGGGTGGHLYPALAIADKIVRRDQDSEILFIGAKKEVSTGIIESGGYKLVKIDVRGFDRKHPTRNVAAIRALASSGVQIRRILKEFKPDAVVGTGGYVSGPVIREAHRRGIPTFIHEQNVIPGVANKLAARYADEIFVAFAPAKGYFKEKDRVKVTVTGNPVRRAFITAGAVDYRAKLGLAPSSMAVMAFGGSQGANRINEVVSEMLTGLDTGVLAGSKIDFFFLTGKRQYFEILEKLTSAGVTGMTGSGHVRLIDYTEAIHEYYAASDIIIARSGALTVSEIAAMSKASILIPSPNVTNNHQYYNAKVLADAGAAVIMDEQDLSPLSLADEIMRLSSNKERLNQMADAAGQVSMTGATDVIYSHIVARVGTSV